LLKNGDNKFDRELFQVVTAGHPLLESSTLQEIETQQEQPGHLQNVLSSRHGPAASWGSQFVVLWTIYDVFRGPGAKGTKVDSTAE